MDSVRLTTLLGALVLASCRPDPSQVAPSPSPSPQAEVGPGAPFRHPCSPGPVVVEGSRNGLSLSTPAVDRLDLLVSLTAVPDGSAGWRIVPEENVGFGLWSGLDRHWKEVMGYVVACAYPPDVSVVCGPRRWAGRFGLAREGARPFATPEDQRRVSACLLAHGNQKHLEQPISIRGLGVPVRPGEDLTTGFPEAVFYGDLFVGPPPDAAGGSAPRYSMSLDLPADYRRETAAWMPPNAVLGRATDFDGGEDHVQFHGPCQGVGGAPPIRNALRFGGPEGASIADRAEVCASGAYPRCAKAYPPVVVHAPWLVNAEDAVRWEAETPRGNPGVRAEMFARGTPEERPCAPDETSSRACLGELPTLEPDRGVCGWVATAPASWTPRVVRLARGDELRAVVRALDAEEEHAAGKKGSRFTAIVRFRTDAGGSSPGLAGPTIRKRNANGQWVDVQRTVEWKGRGGGGFAWLEIYPVFLLPDDTVRLAGGRPGRLSLAIGLAGNEDGATAPEIDAVGFLHGTPACCAACADLAGDDTFTGVCTREISERPRRAPPGVAVPERPPREPPGVAVPAASGANQNP